MHNLKTVLILAVAFIGNAAFGQSGVNPKILTKRAGEVSVRAVISGIILAEVEKKKGIPGIRQVLLCGPGDDAFIAEIHRLIGIDKENFNSKVRALILPPPSHGSSYTSCRCRRDTHHCGRSSGLPSPAHV
jgi:hypothetical protein